MKNLNMAKEGVEFIQQSCSPEEIDRIKAITPQQWVDMMRPLFSTPYFGDEMKDIFITEEILKWGTECQ